MKLHAFAENFNWFCVIIVGGILKTSQLRPFCIFIGAIAVDGTTGLSRPFCVKHCVFEHCKVLASQRIVLFDDVRLGKPLDSMDAFLVVGAGFGGFKSKTFGKILESQMVMMKKTRCKLINYYIIVNLAKYMIYC